MSEVFNYFVGSYGARNIKIITIQINKIIYFELYLKEPKHVHSILIICKKNISKEIKADKQYIINSCDICSGGKDLNNIISYLEWGQIEHPGMFQTISFVHRNCS